MPRSRVANDIELVVRQIQRCEVRLKEAGREFMLPVTPSAKGLANLTGLSVDRVRRVANLAAEKGLLVRVQKGARSVRYRLNGAKS